MEEENEIIEVGDLVKVKPEYAVDSEVGIVGIVLEIERNYYSRFDASMDYDKVAVLWSGDRSSSSVPTPRSTTRKPKISLFLEARRTAEPSNALKIVSKGKRE